MAEKAKKSTNIKTIKTKVAGKDAASNSSKFVVFGIAIVAIIAAIIAVVVAINANSTINDAYFVSDGSKYVLNIEGDEDGKTKATHIVYYYSGDKITGAKSFYEFADEATAKEAYNELKESAAEYADSSELKGKYIVITASDDDIKDITVDGVKSQIEFYESLKNIEDSEE